MENKQLVSNIYNDVKKLQENKQKYYNMQANLINMLRKASHEKLIKTKKVVNHISKKDIILILEARKTGDYSEVFKSKLYNKYSGEYCQLLEIIHSRVNEK